MNKIILILGIVLMAVSVSAISIGELPEITLTFDTYIINNNNNVDDNIYSLYCDDMNGNICHVYRTDSRHTTLDGE